MQPRTASRCLRTALPIPSISRRGGRYNDGRPVKAEDFVYSWQRVIDPRTISPLARGFRTYVRGAPDLAGLDVQTDGSRIDDGLRSLGLAALDDWTFQVALVHPVPSFPWIATLPTGAPVRRDVVERHGPGWANQPSTLITNGAFKLASVVQDSSATLVPNPHYRIQPILREIVAYQLSDTNAAWIKYLNDEIDISNGPPAPAIHAALDDPTLKSQVSTRLEPSTVYVEFNTTKPPFGDPRVRLAFSRAIDRVPYSKIGVGEVKLEPLTAMVPAGVPGHDPGVGAAQDFNPEAARSLLASSGIAADRLEGIHLLASPEESPSATVIQDQLERNLGVRVVIDTADDAFDRARQGDYEMYLDGYYGGTYPDPGQFLEVFLTGGRGNHPKWSNPTYDQLVNEAATASEQDRRLELYRQAQEILVREAPVAFMGQVVRYFFVKPWVRGIKMTPYDDATFPGDLYTVEISIAGR